MLDIYSIRKTCSQNCTFSCLYLYSIVILMSYACIVCTHPHQGGALERAVTRTHQPATTNAFLFFVFMNALTKTNPNHPPTTHHPSSINITLKVIHHRPSQQPLPLNLLSLSFTDIITYHPSRCLYFPFIYRREISSAKNLLQKS
jgi:hypothetical protein